MLAARTYYVYQAIGVFGLACTFTTYAPFLLSLGLSLGEISLLNAVFWLVAILSELPTGMLADGKSRAWSLKMGSVFLMIGAIGYLFAQGFGIALIAESFIGVGMAFFSGAEQAWITDALHREGKDHERRHVFATSAIVRSVAIVIGGLVGSLIALWNAQWIWIPLMITSPMTFFVTYKWMNGQGEPIHKMSEREALRASISLLKKSRSLVWVILAMIVSGGIVAFNHFWSPYFKPFVGTLGLSWVWALIYFACALSGFWVRRLKISQGDESKLILLALVFTGMGLMFAGFATGLWVSLSAAILHEFGRGMFAPLVDSFVQHRVESGFRATFGSLQSFLGRIGLVITPLLIWLTIRNDPNTQSTIGFIWILSGAFIVGGAALLALVRPRN